MCMTYMMSLKLPHESIQHGHWVEQNMPNLWRHISSYHKLCQPIHGDNGNVQLRPCILQ